MLHTFFQGFIDIFQYSSIEIIDIVIFVLLGVVLLVYFNFKYTVWIDQKLKEQKEKNIKQVILCLY